MSGTKSPDQNNDMHAAGSKLKLRLSVRLLAVSLTAGSALGLGCDNSATTAQKRATCEHFAQLAIDELPSEELLDADERSERVTFLQKFCADSLAEGAPLTTAEATCIEATDSLDGIAQCRQDESFLDRLNNVLP